MEGQPERRMQVRFPYKNQGSFIRLGDIKTPPDTSYSVAEIIDISAGGAKLRLPSQDIKEETLMITKIGLPGISASLPVLTKVQWIEKESEKTCIAGIKFILGN